MATIVKEGILVYHYRYIDRQTTTVFEHIDNMPIRLETSNMTPSTLLHEIKGVVEESFYENNDKNKYTLSEITILNIIWL